jgi:hypothetical protein
MKIKRGDTFAFNGPMPVAFPAGNWAAACVAVAADGTKFPLVATLTPGNPMTLSLFQTPDITATWPVGKYKADVQFTDAGQVPAFVASSKTFEFEVIADQT